MEFYRMSRGQFLNSWPIAKIVAASTKKSVLYHWVDCIWCVVRYGCGPTQYRDGDFFKLRSFDRKNVYTKGRGYKVVSIFDKDISICRDKAAFNSFFNAFIQRDWLYTKNASRSDVENFLMKHEKVIVKACRSSKGKDVCLCDDSKMDEVLGKEFLLESFIDQHKDMFFGNVSVNSIRCISVLDAEGRVHIIKATLKAGVGKSIVDNVSAGGVAYPINLEYGRVEGAGRRTEVNIASDILVHPGTTTFMLGFQIPYWKELLQMVEEAARMLPNCRFVGWDVAITQQGPELIEGNYRSGAQLIEYMGLKRGLYNEIMSYK